MAFKSHRKLAFGSELRQPKIVVRRENRDRRSYEAEDIDFLENDRIVGDNKKEYFARLKEKDSVIAELQQQLESLKPSNVNPKSAAKVLTNFGPRQKDHIPKNAPTSSQASNLQKTNYVHANSAKTTKATPSIRVATTKTPKPNAIGGAAASKVADKSDERNANSAGDDRVRRLTDELAKLQAEYARVRTVLQATNQQLDDQVGSSSRSSPTPFASRPPIDVQLSNTNGHANGNVDSVDSITDKSSFRNEIFRLKEELLAAQQKMILHLEAKSAAVEELRLLKEDFVTRESDLLRTVSDYENEKVKLRLDLTDARRQLEESDESKRSLRKRLKESEKEASEMKEFLREEHESMCESFKEAEMKLAKSASSEERLKESLKNKEDVCDRLTEVAENAQARIRSLEAELHETQDGARQLLLKQGKELNACSGVVEQISQLLTVDFGLGQTSTRPTGLVAAILNAEFAGTNEQQSVGDDGREGSVLLSRLKAIERALALMNRRMNALVESLETTKMERHAFEVDMYAAVARTKELECEIASIQADRRRVVEENGRLQAELRESQAKIKESWRAIGERIDIGLRMDSIETELDGERRLLKAARADNAVLEGELKSAYAGDRHSLDELSLKRQIGSLRQEVFDKDDEIERLERKHDQRCAAFRENLAKAEAEVRRLNNNIDRVLKWLKSVPNLTEENDAWLQQLLKDLSSASGERADKK